ncbi:MAG: ABC transporter permease [Candidatus Dojkabacteria bacterium]
MFTSLKQRNTWDLIWQLFRSDFKMKYNDSVLGFIWVLTKPFAIFTIMYFVVSRVFRFDDMEYFPLYLLLGNMFITFWTEGTTLGMGSLMNRQNLITKVSFPRYIVLISATFLALINFVINILIFMVIGIFAGIMPGILQLVWFLGIILVFYFLIIVTSMILSVLYVKFRDMLHIWELVNQLLFWTTPIFYPVALVAERSKFMEIILTILNPISVLLTAARDAIIYDELTSEFIVGIWLIIMLIAGILGYFYYKYSIKKVAEYF